MYISNKFKILRLKMSPVIKRMQRKKH